MRRTRLLPKQTEVTRSIDRKDSDMERCRSSVEELLETDQGRREFVKEELAFEATEKIAELMELTNVSKSELARRTGNSKAYITQVLSGSRNITVHTLAGLAFALGYKITFHAASIRDEVVAPEHGPELKMVSSQPSTNVGVKLERAGPAPTTFFKNIPSQSSFSQLALRSAA